MLEVTFTVSSGNYELSTIVEVLMLSELSAVPLRKKPLTSRVALTSCLLVSQRSLGLCSNTYFECSGAAVPSQAINAIRES